MKLYSVDDNKYYILDYKRHNLAKDRAFDPWQYWTDRLMKYWNFTYQEACDHLEALENEHKGSVKI